MHPNARFRPDSDVFCWKLLDDIAFGMVFAGTPEGPRVAHTPLVGIARKRIRFHLARDNALTNGLDETSVLLCVNGPDGYISPQWYDDVGEVPTWNYRAAEFEGPIRRMEESELVDLLRAIGDQQESRLRFAQQRWNLDSVDQNKLARMLRGIAGFEMTVTTVRGTDKLSQNKHGRERERIVEGLCQEGEMALADAMRNHE